MNTTRGLRRITLTLLLGISVLGCGTRVAIPSTVPVKGVVKIKGQPAPGIRVKLHPEGKTPKNQFVPTGDTGRDGSFTLSTGAPGNGAPAGSYVVTFEKPEIGAPEATGYVETEVDALGGKYSNPAQSKWTVTIVRGENALQPFELE